MITKEMIRDGIRHRDIILVLDPNMDSGTVCRIGTYWFYFGGETAEEMQPEEYLRYVPMEDIVDEVFTALEEIKKARILRDEYKYYEAYLAEQKMLRKDS